MIDNLNTKPKVLIFIYGLGIGGAESFILTLLNSINEIRFEFDIQNPDIKNTNILRICEERKYPIHILPKFNVNLFSHLKALKKLLKNGYDVVHFHQNSLINGYSILLACKFPNKIILHSHNSNNSGGFLGKWGHIYFRTLLQKKKIKRVACSDVAGKWMFNSKDFEIISNAINIDNYKFNVTNRDLIRKQLGLDENCFLIGHVGRFVDAKNHKGLLDIFCNILRHNKYSRLACIGDGPLKDEIIQICHRKNIIDSVYFLGNQNNPELYYSAFDAFILPSKFEGLPFALVEAQCSGLPILASTNITTEANITGNISFISLSSNKDVWFEKLQKYSEEKRIREGEKLIGSNYDSNVVRNKVLNIYSLK